MIYIYQMEIKWKVGKQTLVSTLSLNVSSGTIELHRLVINFVGRNNEVHFVSIYITRKYIISCSCQYTLNNPKLSAYLFMLWAISYFQYLQSLYCYNLIHFIGTVLRFIQTMRPNIIFLFSYSCCNSW